jgi:hypothetical protein
MTTAPRPSRHHHHHHLPRARLLRSLAPPTPRPLPDITGSAARARCLHPRRSTRSSSRRRRRRALPRLLPRARPLRLPRSWHRRSAPPSTGSSTPGGPGDGTPRAGSLLRSCSWQPSTFASCCILRLLPPAIHRFKTLISLLDSSLPCECVSVHCCLVR